MKRFITLTVLLLLFAFTLSAEEEKKAEDLFNTTREFKNRVFEVQHRLPRDLHQSIALLGSGFKGAAISLNNEMRTITVRDFPENIAAIEDALKRLDKPAAATLDIEMKISVLIASKTPLSGNPIPEELAPVVKQLQSTLRYSHYGLMTATVHRTAPGRMLEGSGVADAELLGMTVSQDRPLIYKYSLRDISAARTAPGERAAIDVESFNFSMNVPINMGERGVQYQSVGFQTPVSIRQNEKVVIGTTTMGEKALIVVVTASF